MKNIKKLILFAVTITFLTAGLHPTGTNDEEIWSLGEGLRTIIGFQQSGASSAESEQAFFFDVYVSTPFPINLNFKGPKNKKLGLPLRLWGNVRVTSVPQQVETSVGEFAANFNKKARELKVNEVARAVECMVGVELRFSAIEVANKRIFTLNFIAGFGLDTPLNPKDSISIFKVSPELIEHPKYSGYDFTGKEYAAFVTPERDRFFRQYFCGLRFKSYIEPEGNIYKFPAMLDATLGKNESVTGGKPNCCVLRLDAFCPIRIGKGKVNIYLFGTALLKVNLKKSEQEDDSKYDIPLILEPAPENTPFPAPNLMFIPEELNRDFYRIGIGIDFSGLFSK